MKRMHRLPVWWALGFAVAPAFGRPAQPVASGVSAAGSGPAATLWTAAILAPGAANRPDTQATPAGKAPNTPPDAEALGFDATPIMDLDRALGWDWSLPDASNQPAVLKRIETHKGKVTVVEVQTLPAVPGPVTNPPDPPVVTLRNIPAPNVQSLRTTKYMVYVVGRFRIGYCALLCA